MSPDRAAELGINPDDVIVKCWADRYAGNWVVYVEDERRDNGLIVLFESKSCYMAVQWPNKLRRLAITP